MRTVCYRPIHRMRIGADDGKIEFVFRELGRWGKSGRGVVITLQYLERLLESSWEFGGWLSDQNRVQHTGKKPPPGCSTCMKKESFLIEYIVFRKNINQFQIEV